MSTARNEMDDAQVTRDAVKEARKRLNTLERQPDESLTPVLRRHRRQILPLLKAAIARPILFLDKKFMDDLNVQYGAFYERWQIIHHDLSDNSKFRMMIDRFRRFMFEAIVHDYFNLTQPYNLSGLDETVETIRRYESGPHHVSPDMVMFYQMLVIALSHLEVERDHFEARLMAADAIHKQRESGNYIEDLGVACNWGIVAKMIYKDLKLVESLEDSAFHKVDRDTLRGRVLSMQIIFFEELRSPTDYLLSSRAKSAQSLHQHNVYTIPALRRNTESQIDQN